MNTNTSSILQNYNFVLPEERIARFPRAKRSDGRLLHVQGKNIEDRKIVDLVDLLQSGDRIVVNNTKVMKARIHTRRKTGAAVEVFFTKVHNAHHCSALIRPSRKIKEGEEFSVLSDILGDEDHLGDMDFKVTGTEDGITACQMDIKIQGLSYDILEKALLQAKDGRLHILKHLTDTISEPRVQLKDHTPKIIKLEVPKSTIGGIIGPGGKIIQEMQASTETVISIEEVDEKGVVEILGTNQEKIDLAIEKIRSIAFVPEKGKTYKGKVKSIMPYGAFIGISSNTDGLLHVSEISWERVENVEDVLKEGQEIEVKLIDIDERSGKLKLSRKVLLPRPEKKK